MRGFDFLWCHVCFYFLLFLLFHAKFFRSYILRFSKKICATMIFTVADLTLIQINHKPRADLSHSALCTNQKNQTGPDPLPEADTHPVTAETLHILHMKHTKKLAIILDKIYQDGRTPSFFRVWRYSNDIKQQT